MGRACRLHLVRAGSPNAEIECRQINMASFSPVLPSSAEASQAREKLRHGPPIGPIFASIVHDRLVRDAKNARTKVVPLYSGWVTLKWPKPFILNRYNSTMKLKDARFCLKFDASCLRFIFRPNKNNKETKSVFCQEENQNIFTLLRPSNWATESSSMRKFVWIELKIFIYVPSILHELIIKLTW